MQNAGQPAEGRIIQSVSFLAGISDVQRDALSRYGSVHRYPRHATIQQQGTEPVGVCFLLQGEVVIEKIIADAPEAARLSIVRCGEMFGFGECLLRTCYTNVRALTPVRIWMIDTRTFIDHFLAIPLLRERLFAMFSDMTRILIHRAVAGDARHELAYYLRYECQTTGRRIGRRIRIERLIRQPAVASVLNLSREHVTRLFAELRREKVVDFNRGHPLVDPAWLERMTEDRDLADSLQYRDLPAPSSA